MAKKPTIGIFSLTSCAGCQFNFLFLGDELVKIIDKFNITRFPMAKEDNEDGPFDICLVEGTAAKQEEIDKLKEIRKKCKTLIAMGSCASFGGVPSIKNFLNLQEVTEDVYEFPSRIKSIRCVSIGDFVKVDYFLHGCPFDKRELVKVLSGYLADKKSTESDYPICVECRMDENICLLQQGKDCMGPITHGGCSVLCPGFGIPCYGCRGPITDGNIDAQVKLFKKQGIKINLVKD
ncbi:hypothetical protein ACFLYT_02170 [Nanoarchaeota archaeon]